jgi:hypothetical protein
MAASTFQLAITAIALIIRLLPVIDVTEVLRVPFRIPVVVWVLPSGTKCQTEMPVLFD